MKRKKVNFHNPKTCVQISIAVNVLLTVFKLVAGVFGCSKAMIADAFHSLSDILTSVVVYIGVHIGQKPPDKDHPYGHGNAETIAATLVALAILGVGVFAGVESISAIINKSFKKPLVIALVAACVSIVVKEALYRYSKKVGETNNNPAIIADAWHHRSDALSSIAALIGIIGARISFLFLDPLAGIVVSVLIVKISFELMRTNVGIIMDERPKVEFINHIKGVTQEVQGVRRIDDLKVHRRGSAFTIDLEIAVDSEVTVDQAHKISSSVRKSLLKQMKSIGEVMVHVNPYHSNKNNRK